MRVLVHDYSGHPFQAELSRELARRGHDVTHSFNAAWVSGKGALTAAPGESVVFEPLGGDQVIAKDQFLLRLRHELRWGIELARDVRRVKPDITLLSNVQIPTLVVFALAMLVIRVPWVLWHQDVYSVALRSFAGEKLSRGFRLVAAAFGVAERWVSRRATAIVAIAPSFVTVHEGWGTAHKTTVIPNWAPLGEIVPTDRANDWATEHGLDDVRTLVYSGTLGLKHNPTLLVALARAVADAGEEVRLVVVNEGPATAVLEAEAARLGVPLTLLPFQPYDRLPEVLGSADVLVVLLDREAGAFSVPSKTLSYLCAGRPVLGMMPAENLAAELINQAHGKVVPPEEESVTEAAKWTVEVFRDPDRARSIGAASRELAETEFAMSRSVDRFEALLSEHARSHR